MTSSNGTGSPILMHLASNMETRNDSTLDMNVSNVSYLNITNEMPIGYAVPLYGYVIYFIIFYIRRK